MWHWKSRTTGYDQFYVIDFLKHHYFLTIISRSTISTVSISVVVLLKLQNYQNDQESFRGLKIWVRVRNRVREQFFNSSFTASHCHVPYPTHPMSHPLYLKPIWKIKVPETSLAWKLIIVLVLNLVLVVQSKALHFMCSRMKLSEGSGKLWKRKNNSKALKLKDKWMPKCGTLHQPTWLARGQQWLRKCDWGEWQKLPLICFLFF